MREPMFQNKKKESSLKWAILASLALGLIFAFDAFAPRFERVFQSPEAREKPASTVAPQAAELFNREVFDTWFPVWKELPPSDLIEGLWESLSEAIPGRALSITDKARLQTAMGKILDKASSAEERDEACREIMQVLEAMQVDHKAMEAVWTSLQNLAAYRR